MINLDRRRRRAETTYGDYRGFKPITEVRDFCRKKSLLKDAVLNVDPTYHFRVGENEVGTHVPIGTHKDLDWVRRAEKGTWSIFHVEFTLRIRRSEHLIG